MDLGPNTGARSRLIGAASPRRRTVIVALALSASLFAWGGSARAGVIGIESPPVNTALPVISGTPEVGRTLACSQGSWGNFPTGFAYQWSRDGASITDTTSATYVTVAADATRELTCAVTAWNESGDTSATSNAVTVTAPAATTPPDPASTPSADVPTSPPPSLPPLPRAADVIGAPSTRRCASRRRFRIRIRRLANITFLSASVFVNGKRVKVVRGKRLTAPVDLRGLPRGRFGVRIEVTTSDGRNLKHTRRYRTCTPARKSKRRHRL
jgi:hypothetical protein